MNDFPRSLIGGVSLSRLIIGTNGFLGYSHTSLAKDRFIKNYQTRANISAHHSHTHTPTNSHRELGAREAQARLAEIAKKKDRK